MKYILYANLYFKSLLSMRTLLLLLTDSQDAYIYVIKPAHFLYTDIP